MKKGFIGRPYSVVLESNYYLTCYVGSSGADCQTGQILKKILKYVVFFFFQKLTNMVNKQIPYPYTNTALLMSYDWAFIFKRSWFVRYMTVSAGIGVFAFFQMRKIEIAFHEKCKEKAAADGGH